MEENRSSELKPNNLAYVDSKYKIVMFYNTTIRNVGLFTSVSIAILGYATGPLKEKHNRLTATFLLFSSLAFLILAFMLNYTLYTTLERIVKGTPEYKGELQSWINISRLIFPVHVVIGSMISGFLISR